MDNQQSFPFQHQSIPNDSLTPIAEGGIAITEDESFSFSGFQVVRGEFFAHIYEPSLTLCNDRIYVNTACIKKLPTIDYIQLLVNEKTKKVLVRPCSEDVKDSFRWCSATAKRSPKQIKALVPFGMIFSMMGWNRDYRYKLVGKLIKTNEELVFVFDLTTPEIFLRKTNAKGKETFSRTPSYPDEWKNQFGIPYEEHKNMLQIDTFDGFTVFSVKEQNHQKHMAEANNHAPDNDNQPSPTSEVIEHDQTTITSYTEQHIDSHYNY